MDFISDDDFVRSLSW